MGKLIPILMTLMISVLGMQLSHAQIWSSLRGVVELKDRPQMNGKVLVRVSGTARLKEMEKRGYWVKVEYQGKIGWVPMSAVRLVTSEESTKIDVVHSRSNRQGRVYKHTFTIVNEGTVPFSGTVTLQGSISGEIVFYESVSFEKNPLAVREERQTVVDVKSDFTDLEFKVEN